MQTKDYGGIDPGKEGAIVIRTKQGALIKSPFPIMGPAGKKELNLKKLGEYFRSIKTHYPDIFFVMEEVHSLFGMSASTNFTFGWNNGLIIGFLNALSIPYSLVQPKQWQKEIWVNADIVKHTVKGKLKTDTKTTSSRAAARLYPNEDFTPTERAQKDHDGMVDAALIATYGYRKNL